PIIATGGSVARWRPGLSAPRAARRPGCVGHPLRVMLAHRATGESRKQRILRLAGGRCRRGGRGESGEKSLLGWGWGRGRGGGGRNLEGGPSARHSMIGAATTGG